MDCWMRRRVGNKFLALIDGHDGEDNRLLFRLGCRLSRDEHGSALTALVQRPVCRRHVLVDCGDG